MSEIHGITPPTYEPPLCEVCNKNKSVGTCCVPGVPFSCAYCRSCLDLNVHPWNILVANTACIGNLEMSAPWWKEMVANTCKFLGKTIEQFNEEVEASNKAMEEHLKQLDANSGDEAQTDEGKPDGKPS